MVLDPEGLLEDVHVEDLHLSGSTEQLLPVVAAMPLASAVDYSAVVGKTPSYSYSASVGVEGCGTAQAR